MAILKVGLVGCGRVFKKHLHVLQKLSDCFQIEAVCDCNSQRLSEATDKIGNGVRGYNSLSHMLRAEHLDVVSILTWSGNHASLALECIERGVGNVVVEKPMALKLSEADQLIEVAEKRGARVFVVKQNRFNPPIQALKKVLEAHRLGRVILGTVRVRWMRREDYYLQDKWRGTWAWDGGVLANQASHHLDLLQWLLGPVKSVFAKTATFLAPIEAEDTAVVLFEFQSGALGVLEATTCTRPKDLEGSVSVLGERGVIEIGGFAANEVKRWLVEGEDSRGVESLKTCPENVYGFGHFDFYRLVHEVIEKNKPSFLDAREGRVTVKLLNAIYHSAHTGQKVEVESFEGDFFRFLSPVSSSSSLYDSQPLSC